VAEQKSPRAVEQLLGRVLRLPYARRKRREELNRAYAFATTTSFQSAANTLRDGLVNNGFERVEAQALVRVAADPLPGFGEDRAAYVVDEPIPAGINAAEFKLNLEMSTGGRVEVDLETGRLKARGALSDYDKAAMLMVMPDAAAGAVEALVHKSRGARLKPIDAAQPTIRFAVPRLGIRRPDGLQLFDRTHFLDIPWKLEESDAAAILDFFAPPNTSSR
jgi:type III restriction enzyme